MAADTLKLSIVNTVACIGDGQLARMMHTAGIELGMSLRVLAGSPDASAAQVAADVVLGDYTNLDDLLAAAEGADAITFDHEHVPTEHMHTLVERGFALHPGPDALVYAQDKLLMRQKLQAMGIAVPEFAAIENETDAREFFAAVDGEVCVKARRGGYDGKGVWFPADLEDFLDLVHEVDAPLMAERKVTLLRELSAMVARTPSGQMQTWPVVESVQIDGVCAIAQAPAPDLDDAPVREMAAAIAQGLGVTGVLAVELFDTAEGVVVNELAMRPHNTGHWTQDGCVTDQFEQHLRAVSDVVLGDTSLLAPCTVMANVLGGDVDPQMPMEARMVEVWKRYPEAKIHMYGKQWRPGRKIGHVNITGDDPATVRAHALDAAHFLVHAEWKDAN